MDVEFANQHQELCKGKYPPKSLESKQIKDDCCLVHVHVLVSTEDEITACLPVTFRKGCPILSHFAMSYIGQSEKSVIKAG